MKAVINNQTGLIIESQDKDAQDAALIANAQRAGFSAVSIRIVTEQEHADLIAARHAAQGAA